MRILIIRHAEPDYSIDSLTEKGWREARLLAERLKQTTIDSIYCSPLGRAKDTISFYLQETKMEAVTCDWLREFSPRIDRPDHSDRDLPGGILPSGSVAYPSHHAEGSCEKGI